MEFIRQMFNILNISKSIIHYKMILSHIVQEAAKVGLEKLISGQQVYARVIQKRSKTDEIENQGNLTYEQLQISLPVDASKEDEQKVEEIIKNVKDKCKSEVQVQISRKLGTGSKLPNFGQIKKVFEDGTVQLSAKDGQVLLIDVWATWCGPCQKPMAHNQEMIQKNNWGDKVRIVGVSVDEELEQIKTRVTTKGWGKVEHLTLGSWDGEHELIKNFGIQGIPFVCLVDTKGCVVFMGHPSSIKLEDKINELLAQSKEQSTNQGSKTEIKIENGQIEKLFATIGNRQFFKQNFDKVDFICSKIQIKAKANKGKVSYQGTIDVYVNDEDKKVLEQYQKFVPSKSFKFNGNVVQTVEVPEVSPVCSQCKSQLTYPLYWCKWSENPADFRCLACIDKKQDEKKYSYKSNSILLMAPIKSVSKKKIGNNIQPTSGHDQLDSHAFGCNGCGGGGDFKVGEARFICLGCRSQPNHRGDHVDLCVKCIGKLIQKNEQVIEALTPDGHNENHPFLKVLYNVKGYYDY